MNKRLSFCLMGIIGSLWLHIIPLNAQYTMGVTGLLNVPSADMQTDGTFMAGGNFLPKQLMPAPWDYNTGSYFVNMTFLSFVELAYRCTLFHSDFKANNKWQQDRSVSVRLRPLKEGRYWPAIVVGSNDAFTTNHLNTFKDSGGNRFFSSVYLVGTKHVRFAGHELGFTLGGNIPFRRNTPREGVFGGIRYTPAFLKQMSLMAEYDAEVINVGASARLFNHLSLYAYCYDFKALAAGIRYEFVLIH